MFILRVDLHSCNGRLVEACCTAGTSQYCMHASRFAQSEAACRRSGWSGTALRTEKDLTMAEPVRLKSTVMFSQRQGSQPKLNTDWMHALIDLGEGSTCMRRHRLVFSSGMSGRLGGELWCLLRLPYLDTPTPHCRSTRLQCSYQRIRAR